MEFASKMRSVLIGQLGQERFELWFGERVRFEADDKRLRVLTDTSFRVDRLRKVYLSEIQMALAKVGQAGYAIEFLIDAKHDSDVPPDAGGNVTVIGDSCGPSDGQQPSGARTPTVVAAKRHTARRQLHAASTQRRGRQFRSLESFVVGPCNQLARTSAEMVTRQLGEVSPLVIHGPTGVGKTHLLEGIWCQTRKHNRRRRVLYLSAEQFTTYFLEALKSSGLPTFRRKYRHADLLLIDDIQFFAGKQATLVELTYTIDELAREGCQLILTADRPPSQLTALGKELAARLGGGLVCGMKPLDQVTMEEVSKRWAVERRIVMDGSVHSLVASRMRGDARQLSGVLNRLHASSLALGQPITLRMANEVIHELLPTQARVVRLQDIRRLVCDTFGLAPDSLRLSARSRSISRPRMLAMWLARKHTSAGLHEISEYFGRRSHSSAVTAHKTVDGWLDAGMQLDLQDRSCDVRDIVNQIEAGLRAG